MKRTVKTHKINASGEILGRLATRVADLLRGKNKPDFAYNIDNGDQVVVYNTSKVETTGRKAEYKTYFRHPGRPGSQIIKTYKQMDPNVVFMHAVSGMLPQNKLKQKWLKRLKLYIGEIDGKE